MEQLRLRFGRPEQLIRSQLNSVREVPPISEHHLARIVPFATRVSNLTAFLQSAKAEQHLGSSIPHPHGGVCGKASNEQASGLGQARCIDHALSHCSALQRVATGVRKPRVAREELAVAHRTGPWIFGIAT
ncbi:uncharacterized protein LOC116656386 [Drosophila ananassae]|uniref:uncharacterized protein LOC116656386 n=1 Tax=Drosophila ananassae TaxID=7217 RepID=UPI0013A5CC73|nr:uncharacterized protein LOC116656386 [Drosophila ananassae]